MELGSMVTPKTGHRRNELQVYVTFLDAMEMFRSFSSLVSLVGTCLEKLPWGIESLFPSKYPLSLKVSPLVELPYTD